ncbi:hypothetical protein HPB47_017180 [Ixodes persulcatus]|uniref:Uncharacterized protein n=1 Tax=Ixodes persulcatus TaxID=34615 RepID=A0AC60QSJ2_IXOPE|nr:hypothetical protein HPB47_017180 [Ixodes persulcatus]
MGRELCKPRYGPTHEFHSLLKPRISSLRSSLPSKAGPPRPSFQALGGAFAAAPRACHRRDLDRSRGGRSGGLGLSATLEGTAPARARRAPGDCPRALPGQHFGGPAPARARGRIHEAERRLLCPVCRVPELHRPTHLAGALHQARVAADWAPRAAPPPAAPPAAPRPLEVAEAIRVLRQVRPDSLRDPAHEEAILDLDLWRGGGGVGALGPLHGGQPATSGGRVPVPTGLKGMACAAEGRVALSGLPELEA